jgi:hypothetical protein
MTITLPISVFRPAPRDTVIPSFLAEFRESAEAFDNGKIIGMNRHAKFIKGRIWGHHFSRLWEKMRRRPGRDLGRPQAPQND